MNSVVIQKSYPKTLEERDHVEENFKLGEWIQTQRKAYKAGKMTQERIDLLEKLPGWSWNTRI
jgi:Helicase associated domain